MELMLKLCVGNCSTPVSQSFGILELGVKMAFGVLKTLLMHLA